jgi:hypothetical protein
MVERHHDNAEAVLSFALPWCSYWAALQYWNEFKASIGSDLSITHSRTN